MNMFNIYSPADNNEVNNFSSIKDKELILIEDNCGEKFKVKLYLTEEVKKLLDFMADMQIISFWSESEKEDIYEI